MEYSILNACISMLSLTVMYLILFKFWPDIVEDMTRQKIFKIRDDLFDKASRREDGLSFDSEEYQRIRKRLNILIRVSHKFSLPYMVHLHKSFSGVKHDRGERTKLEDKTLDKAINSVFASIVLKSPILLLTVMLLIPVILVSKVIGEKSLFDKLLSAAKSDLKSDPPAAVM